MCLYVIYMISLPMGSLYSPELFDGCSKRKEAHVFSLQCCGVLSSLAFYQNVHCRWPTLAVQRHSPQRNHLMVDHVGRRSFQWLPAIVITARLEQARGKSKGNVHHGKPNPVSNPLNLLPSYPNSLTLNLIRGVCVLVFLPCIEWERPKHSPARTPSDQACRKVINPDTGSCKDYQITFRETCPMTGWSLLTVKLAPLVNGDSCVNKEGVSNTRSEYPEGYIGQKMFPQNFTSYLDEATGQKSTAPCFD